VLENYFEYEVGLLTSTQRSMLFSEKDYGWFHKERLLVCRRIVNLLTACRLYLDQSSHHLACLYGGDSDTIHGIEDVRSSEYDTHVEYRIMEAIRNYAQHRGFPIHSCSYNAQRLMKADNAQLVFTLTPFLVVEALN